MRAVAICYAGGSEVVALTQKKGSPKAPLWQLDTAASSVSRDGLSARSPFDFAGVQTARADLHRFNLALDHRTSALEVRRPGAAGLVVGVGHVVPERHALSAAIAAVSRD